MGRNKTKCVKTHMNSILSTATKPGSTPFSITEITKKFLAPMYEHYITPNPEKDFGEFLDFIFSAASRELLWFRVTKSFKMPGGLYIAGNRVVQGTKDRKMFENDLLLAALDDNLDFVKIEVCRKKTEHNYQLSIAEWNFIKEKLRRV